MKRKKRLTRKEKNKWRAPKSRRSRRFRDARRQESSDEGAALVAFLSGLGGLITNAIRGPRASPLYPPAFPGIEERIAHECGLVAEHPAGYSHFGCDHENGVCNVPAPASETIN